MQTFVNCLCTEDKLVFHVNKWRLFMLFKIRSKYYKFRGVRVFKSQKDLEAADPLF
jgi:hypothetical protein